MTTFDDATGLMAFWVDIDAEDVPGFQEWHNCEHMPERLSIPGFLRGRRYRADTGAAHFLKLYETLTPDVLSSEAYLAALNAPTDWTRAALTLFRNPVRNVYRLVGAKGRAGRFCAPWLTALRFNLRREPDAEALADWLAAMAAADGIERAQLWAVDEAISGIQTSERRIYGGGPGQQQYLALVESCVPHPAADDALSRGDRAAPALATRQDETPGRYWLEIFHEAPGP